MVDLRKRQLPSPLPLPQMKPTVNPALAHIYATAQRNAAAMAFQAAQMMCWTGNPFLQQLAATQQPRPAMRGRYL